MTRLQKRSLIVCIGTALMVAACGQNIPKADSLEAQADSLMATQAYPAAMGVLQRAVKYDSNEPRRWVKLGRAQRAAGAPALAAISFQHALDLDPANVEALQNLSILEVRAGRYDEARNYVDPLMVLSPDDVAGLLALGAISLFKKQLPQGLMYADKLIKIAPTSLGGYSLKAHVLEAMGRPGEAARVLAQQAVFNPDDKDLALQLLTLYQKAGDREGVRNTAVTLARLLPDDPRYQMESARALHARGDQAKADEIVNGLVTRYSYLPEVAMSAAQFWQATLPHDAAIARIIDLAHRSSGRTQAALAGRLLAAGDTQTVIRMLQPVANGDVTAANIDVRSIYAQALLSAGQVDQAKAVADQVLNFDYASDAALLVRARVNLIHKKYADALNDAQVAVSNNTSNPAAAILVPQIYAASGNQILAARAWGDASSRLPDDANVLAERVKWLFATKQPDIAVSLTSFFARGHDRSQQAWQLNHDTCIQAHDEYCASVAGKMLDGFDAKPKLKPKSGI